MGWALSVLLLLVAAAFLAALAASVGHDLAGRPWWQSSKALLAKDVPGGVAFTTTPLALRGDRLDLGAWHGFQEVLTTEPVAPRELRFQMELAEGAVLSVLFDRGAQGFAGFRSSRNPRFPSLHFEADSAGGFRSRRELGDLGLDGSVHAVRVLFTREDVSLTIDGRERARVPREPRPPGQVGFRGSREDAFVDDVEIVGEGGLLLRDDFARRPSPAVLAFVFVGLLVGVGGVSARVPRGAPAPRRREQARSLALTLAAGLLLVAAGSWLVERRVLSHRPSYSRFLDDVQRRLAGNPRRPSSWRVVLPELRARYAESEPGEAMRVFLVGASQVWGAGASDPRADMASQLQILLRERLGPRQVAVVNVGLSGRDSVFLLERWSDEWIDWHPGFAVIYLGGNDPDPDVLARNLERFAELNRSRGIPTVFALESRYVELPRRDLEALHAVVREVAEREAIDVIDLDAPLRERYDSGFLWWDEVHLSDHGQRLAAFVIADGIAPRLAER